MATEAKSDEPKTTTIQISTEVWAALDRRKSRGDSFDDVIRRLIDATPVGVGGLEGPAPEIDYGEAEPIPDDKEPEKGCVHYDIINGEQCEAEPEYRQRWKYPDGPDDDWRWFFYCNKHKPENPVAG